ncbi:recombinase family protein [Bacillus sp. AFS041924]|uniref:recombinase family protein n=1 Tax=Bacillus sp. AFS041924 TaxID=2033503 RepID=UPI000BFB66C7|nr:recombinase family protein [Bacillus sp. AFS041924]PGS47929.1 resolvase [Bacillus sp. AFS041924]
MLAAIYLRLSRNEEQKDVEEVLLNHKNALIKLANQHNLKYIIYQEISSGVNTEREQLNLLLKKIHEFDYLIIMDIDRLSRDNAHAEQIKQLLILNDIKILTPQGKIDLSQETNEMLFSFQAVLANFEYKQIKKRLSRGRLAAAEQGKWVMSNKTPLGYRKNSDKRLEIVEDEAKIIRYIFDKSLERVSVNEIARQLNMLNWRSRQGKILTTSHISQLRVNPVYYGVIQASRRIHHKIIDEVFIENAHEAIISKEKFFAVQNLLQDNKKVYFQKRKAIRRLQNLIFCNCCGRKRYIQKDNSSSDFIKSCSYKISNNQCKDRGYKYHLVEEFVLKSIKDKKSEFKIALKMLDSQKTIELENRFMNELDSLMKQKDKMNKRQNNIREMRMDGEINKFEFEELKNENRVQLNQINEQIEHYKTQIENLRRSEENAQKIQKIIETLDHLEEIDPELCNLFLKSFIKKIWFSSNMDSSHDTTRNKKVATIKIEWI